MREELERVLAWANEKLMAGEEPPWAWYQYMKLRETVEAILAGMDAATTDHSQQSREHPEKHLRVVESSDQLDSARRHPVGLPTREPM
jgi:hypothetical protein